MFGKYIVVGTYMRNIRTVALSVQTLGWGIRLAYIKEPMQNRFKTGFFNDMIKFKQTFVVLTGDI